MRAFTPMLAALLASQISTAGAFAPSLSPAQLANAAHDGIRLFDQHRGYRASGNLLFAAADTLKIRKGQSPIDAILVGTPYERVRYASYLFAFQGLPFRLDRAQAIASQDANIVQFIVFSHSDTSKDRDFLHRYSNGSLRLGGQVLLASKSIDIFGPALDYFDVIGIGRQFRWIGSVTFRFDLGRLRARGVDIANASGSLAFTDNDGTRRQYPVTLSRYP